MRLESFISSSQTFRGDESADTRQLEPPATIREEKRHVFPEAVTDSRSVVVSSQSCHKAAGQKKS
jgi:hypothetical protein